MPEASLGAFQWKKQSCSTGQGHESGDVRRVQAPRVPECDPGSRVGSRHCACAAIHAPCQVLLADGVFCPEEQPSKIPSMGPEEGSDYRGRRESDCNGKSQTLSSRAGHGEQGFGCARVWGPVLLPAASRGKRARVMHLPGTLRPGQCARPTPALRTRSGRCSGRSQQAAEGAGLSLSLAGPPACWKNTWVRRNV